VQERAQDLKQDVKAGAHDLKEGAKDAAADAKEGARDAADSVKENAKVGRRHRRRRRVCGLVMTITTTTQRPVPCSQHPPLLSMPLLILTLELLTSVGLILTCMLPTYPASQGCLIT
jgi:hypothetical protein